MTAANSVTLLLSIATSYVNYQDASADAAGRAAKYLEAAAEKPYENLRADHVADYQRLFRRVTLDLGRSEAMNRPTDERIKSFADGRDPQLAALMFQFGRYLLDQQLAPGGQPATLQGLWNDKLEPPWGSKYTININTEMNYWPAEVTNLAECHEPLFKLIGELVEPGSRTAKVHYGAGGWVCHHNTDIWRATAPCDGPHAGMWPCGGAWLCKHLWDHYEFSGDREFLKTAYPIMRGAAEFFLDTLVEEPKHHWLVTCPSLSPENKHPYGVKVCAGPTMDEEIIRDLFDHCIQAAETLGIDAEFRQRVAAARDRLAPLQIGRLGQLQEWLDDWDNPKDQHRHISHLYALFPSNQITLTRRYRRDARRAAEAARQPLRRRRPQIPRAPRRRRHGLEQGLEDQLVGPACRRRSRLQDARGGDRRQHVSQPVRRPSAVSNRRQFRRDLGHRRDAPAKPRRRNQPPARLAEGLADRLSHRPPRPRRRRSRSRLAQRPADHRNIESRSRRTTKNPRACRTVRLPRSNSADRRC